MRTIACGFTADIDLIAKISQSFNEEMKKNAKGEPKTVIHTWEDFCTAVDWNFQKGSGAEYIVSDQGVLSRLEKMIDWKKAIGGGGLQAGCVASTAGYGALVNIPKQSEELKALVSEHKGLKLLSDQKGDAPKHYILEYEKEGASNRIIFRKYHEYTAANMIAVQFAHEVKDQEIPWMLVAGYNALDGSKEVDVLLQNTLKMLQTLGNKKPKVHLELASIWSLDEQWKIIRTLASDVETIGLNEDEYQELMELEKPLLHFEDDELIQHMEDACQKLGVANVILHTKDFSLIQSVHSDTSRWTGALNNGSQFAFARAATGEICDLERIRQIAESSQLNPRGVRLQELTKDRQDITVVPAYIGKTVGATGLGDTFTAGFLVEAPV